MTHKAKTEQKKDRFILMRVVLAFFFFGMVKNLVDIVIDDYHFEWILWIKYLGLILACASLFLLYRWGYFLFIAVVLFTIVAYTAVDPETRSTAFLGIVGPVIITAVTLPKWRKLRGWPSPTVPDKMDI